MDHKDRGIARAMARQAIEQGRPLAWFEELYRQNRDLGVAIPWADMRVNPNVVEFVEKLSHLKMGGRALTIGCGLGDDAYWLAMRGFDVTAFDISPTAIEQCKKRFAGPSIHFRAADLFDEQPEWRRAFDLVLESYTLQVLPSKDRNPALAKITEYVAPGGFLIVVARARDEHDPQGEMPWPLTRTEMDHFKSLGLSEILFEDYVDQESPAIRRFRACYMRP